MPIVNVSEVKTFDVYIGRQKRYGDTRWGNPFRLRRDTPDERARVLAEYRRWLWAQIKAQHVSLVDLAALDGKVLGCHCAPKACHGEVLLRAAKWAKEELAGPTRRDFTFPAPARAHLARHNLLENERVLICGQRDFHNAAVVRSVVEKLDPSVVVIEGEARGADVLAAEAAIERDMVVIGFPARWEITPSTPKARIAHRQDGIAYDKAAGPLRNDRMLGLQPGRVIAFAHAHELVTNGSSRGTADMVRRAQRAGVPVTVVDNEGAELVLEPPTVE